VGVSASLRTRPVVPLATPDQLGRGRFLLVAIEVIGTVPGQGLFALSTEELVLELVILAANLFDLGLEFPLTIDGPHVHRLPKPDLLAEIEVVATKLDNSLAELEHSATKLAHQIGQISQLNGWKWVDECAVHEDNTCTQKRPGDDRTTGPEKRVAHVTNLMVALVPSRIRRNSSVTVLRL
jgi:hypothetical protein